MKIVIAANCQSLALARIFKSLKGEDGNAIFNVIFDKPFYEVTGDDKEDFLKSLSEADTLLYQPHIGKQHTPEWRTSQYWIENTTATHCISFASIFFTGYNPELTYIRNSNGQHLNEGFVDYHDKRIAKLYVEGKTPPQILSEFQKILPSEKDVKENLAATLKEMRDRERDFKLDIKLSTFIETNYQKERLFFTYNHPANAVLFEVIRQFLAIIKVNIAAQPEMANELLRYDEFPILPSVKQYLGLGFDVVKNTYIIQNKQYVVKEVVERYFEIYKSNHQHLVQAASQFNGDLWLARKKLIIHIGLSKTGTTSFQRHAHANAAELEKHGLLYPQSGVGTINHLLLAQHLSERSVNPLLIKTLIEEIHASRANSVLLSCEAFEGFPVKKMKIIQECFQEFDIYILCTLRSRLSWIRSMYAEIVKKAMSVEDFSSFVAVNVREEVTSGGGFISRFLGLLGQLSAKDNAVVAQSPVVRGFNEKARYGNSLKQWESVFFKQRLRVCDVESESIWQAIDDISGLELFNLFGNSGDDKANLSPSVLTIELVKRFYVQNSLININYALATNFVNQVGKLLKDNGEKVFYSSHFESRKQLKSYLEGSLDDDILMLKNYGINRSGFDSIAKMSFIQPPVIDSLYQDYQPKLASIYHDLSSKY